MKQAARKLYFTVYLLSLLSLNFAEAQNDTATLNRKIEQLQNEVNYLQKHEKIREKELEVKKKELALSVRENETYIIIVGIVFFIIGLFGYNSLLKEAKLLVMHKVNEKFDDYLKNEKSKLIKTIHKYEKDEVLKLSKKILIISCDDEDKDNIENVTNHWDFKTIHHKIITTDISFSGYDVIVFNNLSKQENIINLITKDNNFLPKSICFLYLGKFDERLENINNLNFANSYITLYPRLLETLKYQEVIESNYLYMK